MSKILMLPFTQQLGTTHRLIEIGKALRDKGQEVYFAGEGKYIDLIYQEKFPVFPLIEINHDFYLKNLDNANLGYHTEETIIKFVEQEVALIEEVKPDIIIDELRLTSSISSKIFKIPKVSVINTILTPFYAIPISVPETHWLSKFLNYSKFTDHILNKSANIIKDMYHGMWVYPYNKVAKKYGISGWKNLYEILIGDYTILPDSPLFAPIKEKRKNIFQVGPIVHNSVKNLPDWIDNIDKNKKIIYCSLGSTGLHYEKVYDILFELFSNNEQYQIITNTTKLIDPKRLKKSKNFFISRLTPASKMMDLCDLTIIHGGIGTIYHALFAKKPIIGIPYQAEQEWNLNRIEDLNCGRKINKNLLNITAFKEIIENTLKDKNINKNVKKIGNSLRRSKNSTEKAANIIINIIKRENERYSFKKNKN